MIKTVFLDMDGVICNFLDGIHRALNIPYNYENYFYERGKWNMLNDGNLTFERVNEICTTEFWAKLKWMHDGIDILRTIVGTFGLEKIYLLTTPMPNLESASGKMMWVSGNLSIFFLKHTIITQAPKHLLARPNTLLIDDKDENVDRFRETGGKAHLICRPWNRGHLNADKTIQMLQEFLGRINAE